MYVTVVGCSPACPNPGSAHSGYLVEADDVRLLLDCGPGVLRNLREAESWPSIDAIAISHLHLDHFGDLVPWALGASAFATDRERPELWLPHGATDPLQGLVRELGVGGILETAFVLREYSDDGFAVGGLEVTNQAVAHYGTRTYGLRVESGSKSVAYSADSAPCDALVTLAAGADAFICEATLGDGGETCTPRGHSTLAETIAAHEAAGSRVLVVTHRPVELTVPTRADIIVARDGLRIAL